jgi:hypothetical protein
VFFERRRMSRFSVRNLAIIQPLNSAWLMFELMAEKKGRDIAAFLYQEEKPKRLDASQTAPSCLAAAVANGRPVE